LVDRFYHVEQLHGRQVKLDGRSRRCLVEAGFVFALGVVDLGLDGEAMQIGVYSLELDEFGSTPVTGVGSGMGNAAEVFLGIFADGGDQTF
jgi:hypothetical protein